MNCIISYLSISIPLKRNRYLLSTVSVIFFSTISTASINSAHASLPPVQGKNTLTISIDDLKQHPEIIFQGLLQAVIKADGKAINILLPLYQQQPGADRTLISWGKAIQAKEHGDYSDAIRHYRYVIAQEPQLNLARLQLAVTLFQNKDRASALQQFNKLRANKNSAQVNALIDRYIQVIQQKDSWSFDMGINYINETNINNAPVNGTRIGQWQAEKRQSGQGFSYYLGGNKIWSLPEGFFSEVRMLGYGKHFTNNHRYDQATARMSSGIGIRDINLSLLVLPFIEEEWISTNDHASLIRDTTTPGLRIEAEYRPEAHWKIDLAAEKSRSKNKRNTIYNSKNHLLSSTVYYLPSAEQFWFAGADYQRENTNYKSLAYQRIKWRLGWGNEWKGGISTLTQLSYANKFYDRPDFFGIKQKGKEYGALLTLWHRDIYFWGITPKINLSYLKNDSNHPFYEYDKKMAFLSFSKLF